MPAAARWSAAFSKWSILSAVETAGGSVGAAVAGKAARASGCWHFGHPLDANGGINVIGCRGETAGAARGMVTAAALKGEAIKSCRPSEGCSPRTIAEHQNTEINKQLAVRRMTILRVREIETAIFRAMDRGGGEDNNALPGGQLQWMGRPVCGICGGPTGFQFARYLGTRAIKSGVLGPLMGRNAVVSSMACRLRSKKR
jgi:hypothetical protein